jgi:hypothetical protein
LTSGSEVHLIILINSVPTAKTAQHFSITKTNLLMLFKEIITVYTENHEGPTDTLWKNAELFNVKTGGKYS